MRFKNLFHQILSPALFFTAMLIAGVAGTGNVHAVTTSPGAGTGSGGLGQGPAPVILGLAGEYVILAKTAVTLTGTTAITGNVGISPAAASFLTGFNLSTPPTTYTTSPYVVGQVFAADYDPPTPSNLGTAILNMQTAFTDAAGRAPDYTELAAGELGGSTLAPGVYKWATSVLITTDVVLKGGPNDTWIFQIAGDLIQASGARVTLQDGAVAKNIFWQVSGMVDHGTTSHFEGITLSQTSIVLKTGATANGRQLAQTAVTMDANAVLQQAAVAPVTKFAYGDTAKAVDTLVWILNKPVNITPIYTGGPVDSFVVTSGSAIPAGVTLNKTTGRLSGTPIALRAAANSTITAYASAGNATRVLRISVVPGPLDSLKYAQDTVILGVGVPAANNTPTWTGEAPTAFVITPLLPAGLTLNTTTGVISGTPTAASPGTNYQVIGSNGSGSDTATVRYTVQAAPVVTSQPRDTTVAAGVIATFSVSATSAGTLSYQWSKNGVNLVNGAGIAGATSSTLSVGPTALSDTGAYSVAVTGTLNGVPSMVVSNNAALKVNTPPTITTQPAATTVVSGGNASFTVAVAAGSGTSAGTLTYQWRKGTTNLTNTGNVTGSTTATLTLTGAVIADTGSYNVVVSRTLNAVVTTTTSSSAALLVNTAPVISTQPANQTVAAGSNATFTVVAATGPGTSAGTLSYQWRKGTTNLTNGGSISGATSAALTLTGVATTDSGSYNVIVTRTLTATTTTTTSANAVLTVNTNPLISLQPSNTTVVSGGNATFTVTSTAPGTLTYQWRKGTTNLTNTGNVTGSTTATLTLTGAAIADTGAYNVVVTSTLNSVATTTTSSNAALLVNTAPVISTQPANQTVATGGNASFTVVAATGPGTSAGTLSYQWRKGTTNLANGGNISGATSATLTLTGAAATDTGTYNVIVTRTLTATTTTTTSSSAMLSVNSAPVIATQPAATTVVSGGNASFTVAATAPGTLTYQWRKGTTNLANTGNVTGSTTSTLVLTGAVIADTGSYNVVVTSTLNAVVTSTTSANAALLVNTAPVISTQPANQTITVGGNATFTVVAAAGSGTSAGTLSYQWRKGTTNLANGGNVSGATSASLTFTGALATDSGSYNVVVTRTLSATTTMTTSSSAVLTTTPVSILPGSFVFQVNGGSNPYTFSLPAGLNATDLVTMSISDIWGRTLWSKSMRPSSDSRSREITWNGATSAGRQASAGLYVVRVSVLKDGATTRYTTKAVTLKPR